MTPYARAAVEDGANFIAYIYGQNLIGQGDAALRGEAMSFMQSAIEDGWPVDPFNGVLQAVQQGDPTRAQALLDLATEHQPPAARQRWDQLISEVTERQQEITNAAIAASTERDRVVADMNHQLEAVSEQRRSVEQVAQQLGVLANRAAGGALAQDYADRAADVERRASRYTWASIILALLIAIGATLATVVAKGGDLLDDAASKAAVAIPLVALNLYLGRLAAQYRQEAVELRHIELQLNTANPFLSALDEERRKDVLSHLAPRFFPGQALPGGGSGQEIDLSQVLAATLVDRIAPDTGRATRGPSTAEDGSRATD